MHVDLGHGVVFMYRQYFAFLMQTLLSKDVQTPKFKGVFTIFNFDSTDNVAREVFACEILTDIFIRILKPTCLYFLFYGAAKVLLHVNISKVNLSFELVQDQTGQCPLIFLLFVQEIEMKS